MWRLFCYILAFLTLIGAVHAQEVVTITDRRYSQIAPSDCPACVSKELARAWTFEDARKEAKALSPSDLPALRGKASGGNVQSQFVLGLVYEFGYAGVTKDLQQALSWFKRAAEGLPFAQAWVGDFYYQGIGIPVDFAEAFRWYKRSAEGRYAYSAVLLGRMHVFGEGVAVNHRAAADWYRRAVELGARWTQRGPGWIQPWTVSLMESACDDDFCIGLRQLIVALYEQFKRYRGQPQPGQVDELTGQWSGTRMLPGADRCTTFVRAWGVFYECEYPIPQDWRRRFDELVRKVSGAVPSGWQAKTTERDSPRPWKSFEIGPSSGLSLAEVRYPYGLRLSVMVRLQ